MKKISIVAACVLVLTGCRHMQPVMKVSVQTEMFGGQKLHEVFSKPVTLKLEYELQQPKTEDTAAPKQ